MTNGNAAGMDFSPQMRWTVSAESGIIGGNRISENGTSVTSAHPASVHKSKRTRPMACSNITHSTPQLNSPMIGGAV